MPAFLAPLAPAAGAGLAWLVRKAGGLLLSFAIKELTKNARERFAQIERQQLGRIHEGVAELRAEVDTESRDAGGGDWGTAGHGLGEVEMPPMWARDP